MKLLLLCISCLLSLTVFGQSGKPTHVITFLGNTGTNRVSDLDSMIRATVPPDVPSSIVFLGNQLEPHGLPSPDHHKRKEGEDVFKKQLALARHFQQSFFIPGNHDWKNGKHNGLEYMGYRQAFLDSLHSKGIHVAPRDGCPGPEEIHLPGDVVLVIIDTQWFLHPWEKPVGDMSSCDCKSAADVTVHLDDVLNRNQGKRVIVAGHHAVYSYGYHGGVSTWKDHVFPFTAVQKSLYIPLPIVGSVVPLYRKVFGGIQDHAHPLNKAMRRGLRDIMKAYPGTVYASGQDHALQFITSDSLAFVESGAATETGVVKKKGSSQFASGQQGFVRIVVFDDKRAVVEYYSRNGLLFSAPLPAPAEPSSFEIVSHGVDSLYVTHQASHRYGGSPWQRMMLGENYRSEWATPVRMKVFDIGHENLGMKILRRGGGVETMSLRLQDSSKRSYNLRSVEKFPTRALRPSVRHTLLESVLQDQVSAEHPYGALAVAPLAKAAGVYHTNPSLVYAPSDSRWGIYRKDFEGQVMLLEEHPDGKHMNIESFGYPDNIISTGKMLEEMQKEHVHIDQRAALRARLFDMWIGDWDRHDDQWRWGVYHEGNGKVYRPIPRDRDRAFFVNEGFIPHQWRKKRFRPFLEGFNHDIRWAPGLMEVGRWFDGTFLNAMTEKEFAEEAGALQKISSTMIDSAVSKLPPEVYPIHGSWIATGLKSRQPRLTEHALQYYRFLSKQVDVTGSDKREWFDAQWSDGDLSVKVYTINHEGKKGRLLYERQFQDEVTREVRLYGMAGNDKFILNDTGGRGVKLRIIGGAGVDTVLSEAAHNKPYVYDHRGSIRISGKYVGRLSSNLFVNQYDRKAWEYNKFIPRNSITYNIDDGVILRGGFATISHGFRKKPYKSHHLLQVRYAIRTQSFAVRYEGRFPSLFGKWDFEVDGDFRSPNFVINFFGWGNQSSFDQAINNRPDIDVNQAIDYYRLRFKDISTEFRIARKVGSAGYVKFGPAFQRGEVVDPGPNHYITEYNATLQESILAVPKAFAGIVASFGIDKRDNPGMPTRGIVFRGSTRFMHGFQSAGFTGLSSSLTLYQSFRLPATVTFVFNAGIGHNMGAYQLFQAQALDGNTEIRGYRETRFFGDTKMYFNNEMRIRIGSIHTYLFPATYGMHFFYDVGRVWYRDPYGLDSSSPTGVSNMWHPAFGGGIWVKPFELTTLVAEVGHSRESTLVYLRLGFLF